MADEARGVKATLLANNNGPVWKIGNDIVTGVNARGISLPGSAGKSVRPANVVDVVGKFRGDESRNRSVLSGQAIFRGTRITS